MLKPRTLGLCALLLGGAVAVLWLAPRDARRDAVAIGEPSAAAARASSATPLDDLRSAARTETEIDASDEANARVVASPTFDPLASATLAVRVVSRADASPLADVRLRVRRSGAAFPSAVDVDAFAATDADGRAQFEVASGVAVSLSPMDFAAGVEPAVQDVAPLAPNERREVVLELDEVAVHGVVVRCDGSAPVAGAHVRLCAPNREMLGPRELVLREVAADADGRFSLRYVPAGEPYLRVGAPKLGSARADLARLRTSREQPLVVCLEPSATLRIEVRDARGAPLVARVTATRAPAAQSRVSLAVAPDFADTAGTERETNSDGRCELEVPANVLLHVRASRNGVAYRSSDRSLALRPGETRELAWTFGDECRIEGRVVDAQDRPCASCFVMLQRRGSERPYVLRFGPSNAAWTRTDDDGRFEFEDILAAAWWIGAWSSRDSRDPAIGLPVAVDVTHTDRVRSVLVRVEPGAFIAGRVLDPSGAPVEGVVVRADGESQTCWDEARSDARGDFRVGPLLPGRYQMRARANDAARPREFVQPSTALAQAAADSSVVTVDAGASDVELSLREPHELRGEVRDARGAPCAAVVLVISRESGAEIHRVDATDGRFRATRLPAGTYDVVASTSDARVGTASAVRIGEAASEISLRVEPGAVLRVHCEAPRKGGWCTVSRGSEIVAAGDLATNGELVCIVPAGAWIVRLDGESEIAPLERHVELQAGARAFVEFGIER